MGDEGATASAEAAPFAELPDEAGYPPLQSVPPRPQLSYTIQQQREIVEALIADRENARYTSQVIRYRSGVSSLPPPPTPPAPTPPEPAPPIDIEPAVVPRDAAGPERRLAEQETLVDFLNALWSDEPAEPAPAPEPAEVSAAAPLPPARSAIAARLAAGPDLIDDLVDASVPQTPLPPGQSALAARLAAAERIAVAAPLPAPRPAIAGAAIAGSLPAPPPVKPILPVSAPLPPRPAERPDRSAAAGLMELERPALAAIRPVVASPSS